MFCAKWSKFATVAFSIISSQLVKSKIRKAAEIEEQKFYDDLKKNEWLKALEPLGTHADKPHLEVAPWLIIVFSERYSQLSNGEKRKNYYVPESVGIASGFLITALHLSDTKWNVSAVKVEK